MTSAHQTAIDLHHQVTGSRVVQKQRWRYEYGILGLAEGSEPFATLVSSTFHLSVVPRWVMVVRGFEGPSSRLVKPQLMVVQALSA